MPKLPPSGYIPVADMKSDHLAKQMKKYRAQVEEQKRKREENVAQFKPKLKVKP